MSAFQLLGVGSPLDRESFAMIKSLSMEASFRHPKPAG
jgi:hypothetical protein